MAWLGTFCGFNLVYNWDFVPGTFLDRMSVLDISFERGDDFIL
jgi:hypothetical protein